MTNALEVVALSKRYARDSWALKDLTLSVPQGGIVGLVGPNGAGKSTLLKTWMGFEKATSGTVALMGLDPWTQRREALGHVAYLAQSPACYRDLTVADHLAFVAHYRRAAFDRPSAERRLSDLGIRLGSKVGQLSGGQTAQLGLAIAFALSVDVLLLDEPLASLDPLARRETIEFLTQQIASSGATAVLSSHIISDIEHACTRIVVLCSGVVALQGSVADVIEDHYVAFPPGPASPPNLVSQLPDGRLLCRKKAGVRNNGRAATLEDVALAYLAAGRTR